MILETDESLKVCYSNKYVEERIREHLGDETLAYITDPQRGFITLYNKPLATLTIKGWGRTEHCNVIVYCSLSKLRRWYGKKSDAIYSCTMINAVKSVMLTCKSLSARYSVPFNTVFRLKRKFAFHTYVSKTTRHLAYQYLHMTCFCYENAFSLCINIGMSHVCVTKTLHCLNQGQLSPPAEKVLHPIVFYYVILRHSIDLTPKRPTCCCQLSQ